MIFLDMDGVLADCAGAVARLVGAPDPNLATTKIPYEFDQMFGTAGAWRQAQARGEEFWRGLQPYPWASRLAAKCIALGGFRICTRYDGVDTPGDAIRGKLWWLQTYLGVHARDVFPCREKWRLARTREDILVDDLDDNIRAWRSAGGTGVLFPRPWNADWALSDRAIDHAIAALHRAL